MTESDYFDLHYRIRSLEKVVVLLIKHVDQGDHRMEALLHHLFPGLDKIRAQAAREQRKKKLRMIDGENDD